LEKREDEEEEFFLNTVFGLDIYSVGNWKMFGHQLAFSFQLPNQHAL